MKILNSEELLEIKGGAFRLAIMAAIGAALTFLIGVLDGFVRPLKCHS